MSKPDGGGQSAAIRRCGLTGKEVFHHHSFIIFKYQSLCEKIKTVRITVSEAPRIFVTALQDELPLLADSPDVKPDVDIVDPIEIDGGELGAD